MKKTYQTPSVEVVKFEYRDQVVAASTGKCTVGNERPSGTNDGCNSSYNL